MDILKLIKYTYRLLLAVAIGLTLVVSPLVPVQAATNPVDLELGGEGATPWIINNIKPGDSGAKTVTLSNVGTDDGFVTIWVSDIISTEGLNPESEMGDTSEPGEADKHLQLNLVADGMSANLDLPAAIIDMPKSATASNCIEIIPLKSGEVTDIVWEWELPTQTGNEAQGDNISFTINYLLEQCTITDVSGVVDAAGVFTDAVTAKSMGDKGKLTISQGIVGKTKEAQPLSDIWLIELDKEKPPPPVNKAAVGFCWDAGPDGATFDQPITITLNYDPGNIPAGISEKDLVIALWDKATQQWLELTNCTVDVENNTISAPISHFSRYTIIAPVPPPPYFPPSQPDEEETSSGATRFLEVNMLGHESSIGMRADGTLSEPFRLADSSGNFIIDIDSGTRISGFEGAELSRVELRITDEAISVPEDMVLLSPVYKLTGYTRDLNATRINFYPSVSLTISYDLKSLPENTHLPFIINYTHEQGLVRLQPPPDSTVETGKAKALISHASLFVVATQVLAPPPPLPAKFKASNLLINPKQTQLGQPVSISFVIKNEGATKGSTEVHLIIDGITRLVKEVTLDANSSETLTFEVSNLAVGNHQVKIAGLSEQFSVVRTVTPLEESSVNWLIIDVSVAVVLIVVFLLLYLSIRRSRRV
jgi:hypothetical protein